MTARGNGDGAESAEASVPPAGPSHGHGHGHGGHGSIGALILGAIGVVYGDIGTSPLYALKECLHGKHGVEPKPENVMGVISLILWSLTIVVTIKYLVFILRADNEGEGGIMAMLALVPEKVAKPGTIGIVALLVIVGSALLFGDGIITPSISVLSAVEGLNVVAKGMESWVVVLTAGILLALFLVQPFGTGGIGRFFGPVMVTWFVAIGVLGVVNIVKNPAILAAVSPRHAVRFFSENGFKGFQVLGGVILVVTGGEALYADMGHFGRRPIRIAWLALVYPALLSCYCGMGAALLTNRENASSPFFSLIPAGPWIYAAVVLASAATVIASQALISGVFSLTHQAIRLGYFPRLLVKHTSGETEGQIYVPFLNWFLAASCISLVVAFQASHKLAAAYGLAVSGTMAITSVVFYEVTRRAWGWSRLRSVGLLVIFLAFDIPFFVANCLKFFDGGYLPVAVGVAFGLVMISWKIGRAFLAQEMAHQSPPIERFLMEEHSQLTARIPGTAIVLASLGQGIPPVLYRLVKRFRVLHEHVVLTTVIAERVPFVAEDKRVQVERLHEGLSRVLLRYGFMEIPVVPVAVARGLAQLGDATPMDKLVYILGRETLVVTEKGRMGRITEPIFALLSRNVRGVSDSFSIPPEQVVEVGMQLDL
jgi:KUP system potassium uptake protein